MRGRGTTESMPLFTFSTDNADNTTNEELRAHGGALVAGVDDTYLIGPPEIVFQCMRNHKERLLADAGLNLNLDKTK